MLTSQQVIDAIHGSYATGSKNGHENVLALLRSMGVDMTAYGPRVIHVAGTNGKGSTCAMLAAVLKAAGYRVGLYTSPFLQRYQERIRIGGVPVTDAQMEKYGNPLVEAARALAAQDAFVTPFEMGTALALGTFAGENCDVAVVEVGMGGRLDPTNIVRPAVCAITNIGLDHMGFLGDTLEEIAGEKAGIIKPGVPVVCYPAGAGVRTVFAEAAARQGAPIRQLKEEDVRCTSEDAHGSTISCRLDGDWQDVRIGLPGQYQQRNAMTVLAVIEELRRQGMEIPDAAVRQGLAEVVWPARLEWCGNVLIDGAHNPQGVDALAQYVARFLQGKRRVLLTGVLRDKLQPEMLAQLTSIAQDMITVTPDSPRAMPAEEYAALLGSHGARASAAASLPEGLVRARALAGEDGLVIAAGSLYFAGGLREVLQLPWK